MMGVKLVLNLRGAYYCHSMTSPSLDEETAAASDAVFNEATVDFRVLSSPSVSGKINDTSFLS